MARLPAIPFDPSGFHRASGFLAQSGVHAMEGDTALGQGIGRGLSAFGAGVTAGKERTERRQDRNALLEERRADRAQSEAHFQTNREDQAREMAFRAEVASLDDNEALLRKMAEPFEAEFASLYMGATPETMADPEFASRIQNTQGQLKRLYEGIGSIRAQKDAMLGEAQVRLRGTGEPVVDGRFGRGATRAKT